MTLEAFAVGSKPAIDGHDGAKQGQKELVDSRSVDSIEDPVIAVGSEGNDGEEEQAEAEQGRYIYMMWKQGLHIGMVTIGIPCV